MNPTDRLVLRHLEAALKELDAADALCDAEFCIRRNEVALDINSAMADVEGIVHELRLKGGE